MPWPSPDLVAPGNLLVSLEAPGSTLYNQYPGNRVPYSYYVNGGSTASSSSYFTLSGTSMAAGVVSGAVADLLQMSPSLTPDQVKARLMKTAYKTFPASSSTTDATTGITNTYQYDLFTVGRRLPRPGSGHGEYRRSQRLCYVSGSDVRSELGERLHNW